MSYMEDRFKRKNSLLPPLSFKKEKKPIAKIGVKKQAEIKANKGGDSEMDLFFASLRKDMTGHCLFCNGSTMKKDDDKFHFSLAHLLPKSIFKSVALLPDNIIELCFWGESCHTNFDNGKISWEFIADSKEFEKIKEQLLVVLPMVSSEEKKHKLYSKIEKLVYSK